MSNIGKIIDGLRGIMRENFDKCEENFSVDVSFSYSDLSVDDFNRVVQYCNIFKENKHNFDVETEAFDITELRKFNLIIKCKYLKQEVFRPNFS